MRMRHAGRTICGFALALFFLPSAGTAQVVAGRVVDGLNKIPVPGAVVALLDSAANQVGSDVADSTGKFRLEAPVAGEYYLLVLAWGYRRMFDGVLELGPNGYLEVDAFILPDPLGLGVISVPARRRVAQQKLTAAGFYDRAGAGFGWFITPEDLERMRPSNTRELFRGIPSVQVRSAGGFAGESMFCNHRPPIVIVDGVRLNFPNLAVDGSDQNVDIASVARIEDIAAVEVYRRASEVPLQFAITRERDPEQRRSGTQCVVVIWTK